MEFGTKQRGLSVRKSKASEHPGARGGDHARRVPPKALRRLPLLFEQWLHLPLRSSHLVRVQELRIKDQVKGGPLPTALLHRDNQLDRHGQICSNKR